jgi:hypothetical protein
VDRSRKHGFKQPHSEGGGWGNTQFLSGGTWVNVNIDADKLGKELPEGGGMLSYKFNLKGAGKHEIWNRVGFELCAVRSSGASMAARGTNPRPTI